MTLPGQHLAPKTVHSPFPYRPPLLKRHIHKHSAHCVLKSWQPWGGKFQPPQQNKNDAVSKTFGVKWDLCQKVNEDSSYMWTGYSWQHLLTSVRIHSHISRWFQARKAPTVSSMYRHPQPLSTKTRFPTLFQLIMQHHFIAEYSKKSSVMRAKPIRR